MFQTQFYFTLTDKEEIEGIIDSVKNNISCELSEVLILVLKLIKRKFSNILINLKSSALINRYYYTSQKILKVMPIFKKGEKPDVSNNIDLHKYKVSLLISNI